MLPDTYVGAVLPRYERGHELASEHDRHGAFQWWLKQDPNEDCLVKLAKLSWLDPDPLMGGYVRECISKAKHFGPLVASAIYQSAPPQQGVQRDGSAAR